MTTNTQSRKWMLTINNPQTCELDHERIREILSLFSPDYFCMADEIATTGTYHTHIFLYSSSPIRFNTVKNRFPTAHVEKALGTAQENKEYIQKSGKWEETEKAETSVEGTFYEFGVMPSESEEKDPKMHKLLQKVKDGMTTTEIIEETPSFAFKSRDIDTLREKLLYERYSSENRNVKVTYLFGASGTGKTSGIYEKHPATDICRITDYGGRNGIRFDSYHGHDVLVLEEFNSQIPIETLLNILDQYPLILPARYNDKVACFTHVYITSNLSLGEQYRAEQESRPETWKALLRRIDKVYAYHADGTVDEVDFK